MSRVLIASAFLCLTMAACAKGELGTIGLGGQCLYTADCASPFVCYDGACQLGPSVVCTADTLRCNGGAVERCATHGERWETVEACVAGCRDGACAAPACIPGERKCDGAYIAECLPDGSGFMPRQACPTRCVHDAGEVQCQSPICSPFETRCREDEPGVLETCNARGTAWRTEPCADDDGEAVCVAGRCMATVCSTSSDGARQERCRGSIAEMCNDTGTGWQTREVCDGGCDVVAGQAQCTPVICTPFETRCRADNVTLQTCNARGTAYVNSTCLFGDAIGRCAKLPDGAGACYPKVCSVERDAGDHVVARDTRCHDGTRQQCNDTETGWDVVEVCEFGCAGEADACEAAACEAGDGQCDGLSLTRCRPDRKGFAFVQHCPSGCDEDGRTASCRPPVCSPLSRQCETDHLGYQYVRVCRADGSGMERLDECPQGCVAGVCVSPASSCVPGEVQCRGVEAEKCVLGSDGRGHWQLVERCLGTCSAGSCSDAGACGCPGDSPLACGSPLRPALTLTAAVPSGTQVPCDALSTVLLVTNELTNAAGQPVPDGTLVTFAAADDAVALVSSDADAELPGLQRPTLHGRAAVVIKSPLACTEPVESLVHATLGGRCAGSATVAFQPRQPLPRSVYIAEDFSTLRNQDPAATTALWDTRRGSVEARTPVVPGTGADGDYVATSATANLHTAGLMPAWTVQSIGTQEVTIDAVQANLAPGDEVVLYTVWGGGYNGLYEFKHVAAVSTGRVVFTEPIARRLTGAEPGAVPSGYRVVLQRVPHFENVTVPAGLTLTSSAVTQAGGTPTAGTGLLAFRARGTVNIQGSISMVGKGLPMGTAPNTVVSTSPTMPRLLVGNPSSTAGSGAIYIHARAITFRDEGVFAPDTSIVTAEGSDLGSSGSVWLAANDMVVGTSAPRIRTGGQLRVDFATIDNRVTATVPAPGDANHFSGQAGGFIAQSRSDTAETTARIRKATLLGVLGGNGTSTLLTSTSGEGPLEHLFPELTLKLSADGGVTRGDVDFARPTTFTQISPVTGTAFSWRASLVNSDENTVFLRGLSFSLDIADGP